jgi:hypothetical protein
MDAAAEADGATLAATDGATLGATDAAVVGAVVADEPLHAERMMADVAPSAISRLESCNACSSVRSRTPLGAGSGRRLMYARIGKSGAPIPPGSAEVSRQETMRQ